MSDFTPFALLVQQLKQPRSFEEMEAARMEAAKVLERLGPLAKLVHEAIDAENADCVLVRGDPPRRRYVTLQDAVVALQAVLMRAAPTPHPKVLDK